MAMTRIRVGLPPGAMCIAGTDPVLKLDQDQNPVVDRDTKARLFTVTLMLMEEGRAEIMKVTVPETGLPNGLRPGSLVLPVELFATPWARIFNGNLSDGVAYRALRLDLAQMPATAQEPTSAEPVKKAA